MNLKPASVTIFAYQVGFGDCFLLRFEYPDTPRHVLIDFGTTGLPEHVASDQMLTIANDIADKCGQLGLDAVVATHRHADHISGFATKANGKGSGDVIRALKPRVVVQPWTEDPDLAVDAKGPQPLPHLNSRAAVRALARMQDVSAQVVQMMNTKKSAFSPRVAEQLRFIGEDNLSNAAAVKNLASMGAQQVYTYCGGPSGLEAVLPGIKTHVLGPPTLEQSSTIAKMRSRDPDEFWQLQHRRLVEERGVVDEADVLFPDWIAANGGKLPTSARWLAYRMREARSDQTLDLVRILDKQLNNTSVILLFESAAKKLLFPGDAQIENWKFALAQEEYRRLLADVDLYKVGHHGSLNATPRSMWNSFTKKGGAKKSGRLQSILSTKCGKHGSVESRTEVPRTTLLSELNARSKLFSTHTLDASNLYQVIEIDL